LEEFNEKVIKEKEMLIDSQKREIIDLMVSDVIECFRNVKET